MINGFSIGTWVSNVDGFGDGTSYELDGYFGYSFGPVSVGYIYYAYPDGDDLDFSEVSISAELGAVTLGVAVLADADWEGTSFGDDPYFKYKIYYSKRTTWNRTRSSYVYSRIKSIHFK